MLLINYKNGSGGSKKVIEKHPDNFLRETAVIFNCSTSCIHYLFKKLKITHKKIYCFQTKF
ncbi:MAG: hypothetical protein IJP87_06640 [Campylobacter sp.]|nr:hypothetical protein [Campylobacter sp.]